MANISKKYTLNGKGILVIDNGIVGLEDVDTGELIEMKDLLADFKDRTVKLSISYDEEYGQSEDE